MIAVCIDLPDGVFFSAAESDSFCRDAGNATDGGYDREEERGDGDTGNAEVPDEAEEPDDAGGAG